MINYVCCAGRETGSERAGMARAQQVHCVTWARCHGFFCTLHKVGVARRCAHLPSSPGHRRLSMGGEGRLLRSLPCALLLACPIWGAAEGGGRGPRKRSPGREEGQGWLGCSLGGSLTRRIVDPRPHLHRLRMVVADD